MKKMEKKKNSLFLADIDPNQKDQAVTANQLRRTLLHRLLIWDSIVVSDSQMLQDPRFRVMMQPTVLEGLFVPGQKEDQQFDDLEEWQRGFESLLRSGLVEVACRDKGQGAADLYATWTDMVKSENEVPFLPKKSGYAKYIEKIGYMQRRYSLKGVADRFKRNLQIGISKDVVKLDPANPAHKDFETMISDETVQLRDILQLLNQSAAAGEITEQEKNSLYEFCFRCYSVNVPAETDCYTSAKIRQIPLFLQSGTHDGIYRAEYVDPEKMRSSWAVDPCALDLLPLDAFVKMREDLYEELQTGLILRAFEGNLQNQSEANEFYDVWSNYTEKLENALLHSLRTTRDQLSQIMRQSYVPAQKQLENKAHEFVINHFVPDNPIKKARELIREIADIKDSLVIFNQKQAQYCVPVHHDQITQYMDGLFDRNSSIITKYDVEVKTSV